MTKQQLIDFVLEEYGVEPDCPFEDEKTLIFRHKSNRKWFCALMFLPKNKICGEERAKVDVLNLKVDPIFREALINKKGIYTAYHMNKTHWVSVLLEEAEEKDVHTILDMSFDLTNK